MTTAAMAGLPLRESREIQGDILAGFKKDHMQLLFLRFGDQNMARTWLKRLRPRIATTRQVATFNAEFSRARKYSGGDDPKNLTATWRGVSFTYPGMKELVGRDPYPPAPADSTLGAFAQGPAHPARAGMLDPGEENSPENWLFGNSKGQQPVHAVLTIAADRIEDLRAALSQERQEAAMHRLSIVFEQDGATLEGTRRGKEHFGFKDGVSEPAVRGFDKPDPKNPQWEEGHPGTRLIPAGEFVIGEERAGGRPNDLPQWATNGSFHVVRRLGQDVPGWWAQVSARLKELKRAKAVPPEATAEWLAARVVGRWTSGTPITKCPFADSPNDAEAASDNDISYKNDLEGELTPLWSHLRKTNPRDGLALSPGHKPEPFDGPDGLDSRRIMRRGIPYGQPFDPAAGGGKGADAARGLLLITYQSDLVRQFEFIQRSWINNADFPMDRTPEVGRDPMVGPDTTVRFNGQELSFQQFVHTEGAVYAFAPSLTTIELLAEGKLTADGMSGSQPGGGMGGGQQGYGSRGGIGQLGKNGTAIVYPPWTIATPVTTAKARLVLEPDGNLVVYDEKNTSRWESNTARQGGVRLAFEEDGNLVIYNKTDQRVWRSRTVGGNADSRFHIQEDGNVAIYAGDGTLLWQTGTAH